MESTISATYLAKNLSDVLSRVRDRGERFVIQRDGQTIATIIPPRGPNGITVAELVARIGDLPIPEQIDHDRRRGSDILDVPMELADSPYRGRLTRFPFGWMVVVDVDRHVGLVPELREGPDTFRLLHIHHDQPSNLVERHILDPP